MQPYWGVAPPPVPAPPARPRWWIALVVAFCVSLLAGVFAAFLYVLAIVLLPLLVLGLAVALTVCFTLAARRPDAVAVGIGLLISVPMGLGAIVLFSANDALPVLGR